MSWFLFPISSFTSILFQLYQKKTVLSPIPHLPMEHRPRDVKASRCKETGEILGPYVRVSPHGKREMWSWAHVLLWLNLLLNPQVLIYRNKIFLVLEEGGSRFWEIIIFGSSLTWAIWPQLPGSLRETVDRAQPRIASVSLELEEMIKAQVRFVLPILSFVSLWIYWSF